MTTVDPTIQHASHIDKLIGDLSAKPFVIAETPKERVPEPPPAVEAAPEAPAAEVEAPVAEAAAEEAPVVEAPPAAKPAQPAASKLARSQQIQQRHKEARQRAQEAVKKLQPQAPEPPKAIPQAQPQNQGAEQVARLQAQLDAELRQAKTNPLEFARRHGVSGADIAEFVRNGTDPNQRAVELLRNETTQAIRQVRQEYSQQLQAVQSQLAASEEARVQQNFFTFVEEAKDANPEAFAALNSGLVYNEKDVWETANRLMEERADLRDNFDEDRLLEAVEAEARKDPRWSKVQKLISPTQVPSSKQPKVSPQSQSNVRAKEEPAEEAPKAAATPKPTAQRDPNGRFKPPVARSPFEEHQIHVSRVLRGIGVIR